MKRLLLSAVLLMSGISAQDMMIKDSIKVAQPTDDSLRVVTNRFWNNWFVFGNVGAHLFSGDYSSAGDFSDRISPDFFIGVGSPAEREYRLMMGRTTLDGISEATNSTIIVFDADVKGALDPV